VDVMKFKVLFKISKSLKKENGNLCKFEIEGKCLVRILIQEELNQEIFIRRG